MRSKGAHYESEALRYLQLKGLSLLEKNFRSRYGEIDLIMRDDRCLTFIEVRYRKSNRFSTASESVGIRKQMKIIKAATSYLCRNPRYASDTIRFDVIAIDGTGSNADEIQWMQDAFRP